MARYTGPVCRLCRQQGQKLFLKGERCLTPKCAVERRRVGPGEQSQRRRRRLSEWGLKLREKQKARQIYGILEAQFRRHYTEASRRSGITGENFLQILESRLDNVTYRLGFADSRNHSRQLVSHGHVAVNGRKRTIPSSLVRQNDQISWTEQGKKSEAFEVSRLQINNRTIPTWLTLDPGEMQGRVLSLPQRSEIDTRIEERLIVEHYAR